MKPITLQATSLFVAIATLAFALAGCSDQGGFEMVGEVDDPVYRRAKNLLDRGMQNEALENYLKLIQLRNGNAPESHLDAGNIYLNHMNDPISAIYHFMRYKSLAARQRDPRMTERVELVDDLVKTAKKRFAASLDMKVYRDPLERLKLMDTIEQLRSENEILKKQLTDSRNRLNQLSGAERLASTQQVERESQPSLQASVSSPPALRSSTSASQPPARPEPVAQRTYTIQPGDSLYRIARKAYGDGTKWQQILEANRGSIPDPGNLKVGATIVLP